MFIDAANLCSALQRSAMYLQMSTSEHTFSRFAQKYESEPTRYRVVVLTLMSLSGAGMISVRTRQSLSNRTTTALFSYLDFFLSSLLK